MATNNLLSLDTSTRYLKLAVSFGPDRLVRSDNLMERSHGQLIFKKIDELFQSAGEPVDRLEGVVVCLGPGSFTGLRIGLAAAKGMAVALGIPLCGISLFDLAADKLPVSPEPVSLIFPHRRDEFLTGAVAEGRHYAHSIATVSKRELAQYVSTHNSRLVGFEERMVPPDEAEFYKHVKSLEYDAGDLLEIGRRRFEEGISDDLTSLEPLYLQKSQAEIRFDERQRGQ